MRWLLFVARLLDWSENNDILLFICDAACRGLSVLMFLDYPGVLLLYIGLLYCSTTITTYARKRVLLYTYLHVALLCYSFLFVSHLSCMVHSRVYALVCTKYIFVSPSFMDGRYALRIIHTQYRLL